MSGQSMNAVLGGDRPISTERVVYKHKEKPTGLNWAEHTAPAPVIPIGNDYEGPATTVDEDMAEMRARLDADLVAREAAKPKPKTPRAPRTPRPPAAPRRPIIDPSVIVADYEQGMTVAQLCQKHDRSNRFIYNILHASEAALRDDRYAPNRKVADPELRATVIRLYVEERKSQTEIIKEIGLSYVTIRKILLMENVAIRRDQGGRTRVDIDVAEATRLYQAGLSIPQIADQNGWPVVSTRRALQRSGLQLRDDRHFYSGGGNKRIDTPEVAEKVRQMYVDLNMSQGQIAVAMRTSRKVIQGIMSRAGIEGRTGQSGSGDTLGPYRERLDRLNVTTTDLRSWATAHGLTIPARGLVPTAVVDAFEEAHR